MGSLTDIQRRQFLKAVGAFFLAQGITATTALRPAFGAENTPANTTVTLKAFVDVLLPKDTLTPAASTLNVHLQILELAEAGSLFEKLLDYGCRWLNMAGGGSFADLPPMQKYQLVKSMTDAPWDQVPRRFYELVRNLTVNFYYSHPASWNGLAINQPPQPEGYPPPW